MAKADPLNTRFFIDGRDLLGLGNVNQLDVELAQESVETTGIGSAQARHELLNKVGAAPLSFNSFLDGDDPPEGVVRGIMAGTVTGGVTLRLWTGRGEPSIVSERATFTTRKYPFGQSDFVRFSGEGTLENVHNALTVEDRTIVGPTGVGGETARAVELRSPPFDWQGPISYTNGNTRARLIIHNDLITNRKVQAGDEIALTNLTPNTQVRNLFQVAQVIRGNTPSGLGVMVLADPANPSNAWFAGGSQQVSAMNALAAQGNRSFRVVHHAGAATRPEGRHGMVVHVPQVVWQDANRLSIRPIYRTLTGAATYTAWDRTATPWVISRPGAGGATPDTTPRFRWFEYDTQQLAQVAFDWLFTDSGGSSLLSNQHSFRVLADYVPKV